MNASVHSITRYSGRNVIPLRALALMQTEIAIAEIWSEVFAVDSLGLDDDFFDLGGHSMTAVKIAGKINDMFGCSLKVGDLAEATTIRSIARLVEERAARDLPSAA